MVPQVYYEDSTSARVGLQVRNVCGHRVNMNETHWKWTPSPNSAVQQSFRSGANPSGEHRELYSLENRSVLHKTRDPYLEKPELMLHVC